MQVFRLVLRIFILLFVPAAVAWTTYRLIDSSIFQPPLSAAENPDLKATVFEVTGEHTFDRIAQELANRGLLKHAWSLNLVSRIVKPSGSIKPGEYELKPTMTPKEILLKLTSGNVLTRPIQIPDGASVALVGEILSDAGILQLTEYTAAVSNKDLVLKAGLGGNSFEGYLSPGSYAFARPISPESVLWRMLEEAEAKWPASHTTQADALRMSRHEVLTLASIIQLETSVEEERPLISAVFHNRLKQGMKLEADSTVRFAKGALTLDNGVETMLTPEDLQLDSPYNTHKNFGLPPGPICNPGESAIKAALFPAEVDYLFYLRNSSGAFQFATTLEEYNKLLNTLQEELFGNIQP